VTGFKTSFGVFPLDGVLPYARNLDTPGFFTHTPLDMLLLWEALDRPAARDQELVLGVPDPMPDSEPEMRAAVQRALQSLRQAGIPLRRIDISAMLAGLSNAHRTIMFSEGAAFHRQRVNEHGDWLAILPRWFAKVCKFPTRITTGHAIRRRVQRPH
jgi:Asp-tRNA(Asn)/Glu-tRNA(Gln) amidotransferase A subunit family amidase